MSQNESHAQVTHSSATFYGIINPEIKTIENEKSIEFQNLFDHKIKLKKWWIFRANNSELSGNETIKRVPHWNRVNISFCKFSNMSENDATLLIRNASRCYISEIVFTSNIPSKLKYWMYNFSSKLHSWELFIKKTSFETTKTFQTQFFDLHSKKIRSLWNYRWKDL